MTIQLYDLATADPELRFSPFCWRVKMALAHKGLEWDEIPIIFTEKQKLPAGNVGTVPVLVDDGTVVNDSWTIAEYLDKKYPDNPLFACEQSRAHALLIKYWVDKTVHPFITGMGVGDFMESLDERDKPYFNETREKRLGESIAQHMQKREQSRVGFRKSLEPLRAMLVEQAYIAGDKAGYADYIVFGNLQWMRCGSPYPSLERDDPVFQYRERLLDLFDGLGRKAKFREIMD